MKPQFVNRQVGFYKVITAETQFNQNGDEMYWVTEMSRTLITKEEYEFRLLMEH